MSDKPNELYCWKKDCGGLLIFVDSGACFQRWKCHKCGKGYTLSHAVVNALKNRAAEQ